MVLRSLLARRRDELKLFRASARLTGFARQLSLSLRELQRNQLTPESLQEFAAKVQGSEGLALKLQDLAALLRHYLRWLDEHRLQDADRLLDAAAECLRPARPGANGNGHVSPPDRGSPLPHRVESPSRRRQDWRGRGQLFLSFGNDQPKT